MQGLVAGRFRIEREVGRGGAGIVYRATDSLSRIEVALKIIGARHNNLQGIDVEIPLGAFVCVSGVSGSGKSSLVNDILVEALRRDLNGGVGAPGQHDVLDTRPWPNASDAVAWKERLAGKFNSKSALSSRTRRPCGFWAFVFHMTR